MNSRSYGGGGRDDRMDRGGGMDRGRRSPMRDTGDITSVFVRNVSVLSEDTGSVLDYENNDYTHTTTQQEERFHWNCNSNLPIEY